MAVPSWKEYSGPCLVAGNAWTLPDDLERARRLFPTAPVIAVNGAAEEVKAIALFSFHPQRYVERGYEWIQRQKKIHNEFTVHSSKFVIDCPWVEYWWPETHGGGSSAWGARKLALYLGFDLVVLVGCPLVPGEYAGHKPGRMMAKEKYTSGYAIDIEQDVTWHAGAYSMSGRTKEILGSPC